MFYFEEENQVDRATTRSLLSVSAGQNHQYHVISISLNDHQRREMKMDFLIRNGWLTTKLGFRIIWA